MSYAKGYGVNKTTREYIDEFKEEENASNNKEMKTVDLVKAEELDLKTLEHIKQICDFYSDMSSRTLGYSYVCQKIDEINHKNSCCQNCRSVNFTHWYVNDHFKCYDCGYER